MAISTAPAGRPYTTGVVVFNTHSATVHLIRARPIVRSHSLEVLGTGAAGSRRAIGEVLGTHGWPPADRKPEDQVRYLPMAEVPVPQESGRHARGVNIVIGVRYTSGHEAWFDGLEVTYRVGTQIYIGRFPMAFALCDHLPCDAPETGPPWGPPP